MNWRWLIVGFLLVVPLRTAASSDYVIRDNRGDGSPVYRLVSADELKKLPLSLQKLAQPNRFYHSQFTPNDPGYALQWNFGVINVPGAWSASATPPQLGDARVVVAVLDTGVAYANNGSAQQSPDLAGLHVWTNTAETAGDNIDNDGNGLIDDVNGWNFVDNNNWPLDNNGHGTHIAAIIAAGTNNSLGEAGIASGVTVMPLKVLDADGDGTTLTIAQAVDYAVAHGANVVNLSLGGSEPDTVLQAAIQNAASHGVIVVAATGNDGERTLSYPARYAETIAVGATQYDGSVAPYSNIGTELDIMAPGGNLSLDQNGDGQVDGILEETCTTSACSAFAPFYYTGTSQATAHVTAVTALVESCLIGQGKTLANESVAVREAVLGTATDLGSTGYDTSYGYGLVNAQAALSAAGCSSSDPAAPTNLALRARANALTLTSTRSYPYATPQFSWTGPAGVSYQVKWGLVGATPKTTTQTATTFKPTVKKNGTYVLEVSSVDDQNRTSASTVLLYRYRASQLLISSSASLTVLNTKGVKVRSINVGSNLSAPYITGGTVTSTGDDRYLVSRAGLVDLYRSSGTRSSTIKPFGGTKQPLEMAIVRLQNQPSIYSVVTAGGSEGRIVDSKGKTIKRLVFGNGHVQGLRTATGDIDGDRDDEIIFADRAGSAIRLYNTDGSLIKTITPAGKKYQGGWSIATGDVNGDGKSEVLAIPASFRANPVVYEINGTGQVLRTVMLSGLKSTGPVQITAADLDGNGKDELIIYAPDKAQLTTWSERGTKLSLIAVSGSGAGRNIGRLQ